MKLLPKTSAKPALTIIELIVAMSIFAVLATMGIMVLSQVSKISRQVEMEEYLYTETQAVLERISKTIQSSAIDYEEYYNQNIELGDYGENYGSYHAQFFDGVNEMGLNPATGDDKEANAFCAGDPTCSTIYSYHLVNELYLINGSGTERTYFAIEDDADGNQSIAVIEMQGSDTDEDGLIDAWVCSDGYTCDGTEILDDVSLGFLPNPVDLTDGDRYDTNFVPLTPSSINISEFYFYLSPIEDPFKGFAEDSEDVIESVQVQPKVTIIIIAEYIADNVLGSTAPNIQVQTTIGTGV